MGGFFRFVALVALLIAVLGLVVVPLAAGTVLTGMVRDMGLKSDNLQVSVAMFDPLLFLGRSRSMHLSAGNVDLSPASVGSLELTLGDVSLLDRTWGTVDGELRDVSLTTGGQTFGVESLAVEGPADVARASVRMTADQTEALIKFVAAHEGLALDDVTVTNDGLTITVEGVDTDARLEVRGGALVLLPGTGTGGVPLIQPAPSDAWQLNEAWISDSGLNVRGTVDTMRLAADAIT